MYITVYKHVRTMYKRIQTIYKHFAVVLLNSFRQQCIYVYTHSLTYIYIYTHTLLLYIYIDPLEDTRKYGFLATWPKIQN